MPTLKEISELINAEILGNEDEIITNLSSLDSAKRNSICIIFDEKYYQNTLDSNCQTIVIPKTFDKFITIKKNILIVNDINESLVVLSKFFKEQIYQETHNSNFSENSFFGENVIFGDNFNHKHNVIIESNVEIGNDVFIDHNVVIYSGTVIGNNVLISAGTIIGSEGFGNVRDNNGSWKHISHIGGVRIGSNVRIGANCTIDRGTLDNTIIGNGVIIDNSVHIAHNVNIGSNTAIAAKTGIAGSCKIGKRNMIGGMVGIVDHIKTADDVIISATSTVFKDINKPGIYTGIMPISEHITWKRIALWISKLDKIAKFLNLKKI